ncbi:hypothetical protein LCGC14_2058930 [marine sediment metagenome]|uniref:Uncharacterized protein n=1 Tax=marine sediment metagenome TaxID=412755 RepID=A0A0F9HIR4_9ZZZZ
MKSIDIIRFTVSVQRAVAVRDAAKREWDRHAREIGQRARLEIYARADKKEGEYEYCQSMSGKS